MCIRDRAPARLSSEIRLYSTRLRLCCQFPFRSKQQDPPLETLDFPPAIPYNEHDRLEPDFDMPPVSKTAGWNRKVCSFMTDAIHPDTDIQAEETPILTLDPFAQVTPGLEPAGEEAIVPVQLDESTLTPAERKMVDDFARTIDVTDTGVILQYLSLIHI